MSSERLQKILAHRGVASRRASEDLILAGRVKVNGVVVRELGAKADPDKDEIVVDGEEVESASSPIVVMLNKPKGYVCTVKDPHADKTVMQLVDYEGRRLYPVGRLDKDSRGLLLLTDDGDLANRLLHPSHEMEKTYEVKSWGKLTQKSFELLTTGVMIEGGITLPARVEDITINGLNAAFRITIREGRKRQIRMMLRALGARVNDLKRIEFAGLKLGTLPEGYWRQLSGNEHQGLRKKLGLPALGRRGKGRK